MVAFELVSDDDLLQAVRSRGPILPMEIRSVLGKGDSITIGAALSSTVSRGQVKITNVKRGGSPFYYVPGQEHNLEKLGEFLNEKDKRTFHYLKEKKIIRDREEEPLTRVSLRNIPDFAKKVIRFINGEEEIFWRWFLVPEDEALYLIEKKLNPSFKLESEQEAEVEKVEPVVEKFPEPKVSEPVPENNIEHKKEVKVEQKREVKIESSKPKQEKKQKKQEVDHQTSLPEEDDVDFFEENSEEFLDQVKEFFDDSKIIVKSSKLIRRGSDYEFVILMDTPVGKAEYFCKARGKKRCNDGDLSQAYLQGQVQRLPVLFLTNGEITIKAKDKLGSDFKGMLVKELL